MRTHRIHVDDALEPGQSIRIEGSRAHYLSRVLRVAPGQSIVLFNGDGHDYASEPVTISKSAVDVDIHCRLPAPKESGLAVTVVQAISRGERMDQTLQKCTELGATAFQPLLSGRVEVKLKADRLQRRMLHWRSVIVSACEQSGRAVVPQLAEPLSLEAWLACEFAGPRLVLDPEASESLVTATPDQSVELAIGPEGGFSENELNRMKLAGVQGVSIGPRILRTETAGPAALSVLQAIAGDFR